MHRATMQDHEDKVVLARSGSFVLCVLQLEVFTFVVHVALPIGEGLEAYESL